MTKENLCVIYMLLLCYNSETITKIKKTQIIGGLGRAFFPCARLYRMRAVCHHVMLLAGHPAPRTHPCSYNVDAPRAGARDGPGSAATRSRGLDPLQATTSSSPSWPSSPLGGCTGDGAPRTFHRNLKTIQAKCPNTAVDSNSETTVLEMSAACWELS